MLNQLGGELMVILNLLLNSEEDLAIDKHFSWLYGTYLEDCRQLLTIPDICFRLY